MGWAAGRLLVFAQLAGREVQVLAGSMCVDQPLARGPRPARPRPVRTRTSIAVREVQVQVRCRTHARIGTSPHAWGHGAGPPSSGQWSVVGRDEVGFGRHSQYRYVKNACQSTALTNLPSHPFSNSQTFLLLTRANHAAGPSRVSYNCSARARARLHVRGWRHARSANRALCVMCSSTASVAGAGGRLRQPEGTQLCSSGIRSSSGARPPQHERPADSKLVKLALVAS
eukprot:COSAG01_NODE_1942_length_8842_cov_5.900492_7_plen_228_part_00